MMKNHDSVRLSFGFLLTVYFPPQTYVMLNPFDLTMPIQCRHDQCNMWVYFLGKDDNKPDSPMAPCREYVCYVAQFINSNGGSFDYSLNIHTINDQHCGPRFLRDALQMCDWGFRGCGSWGGMNSRLPQAMPMGTPGREKYLDMGNRGSLDDLDSSTLRQFKNSLGWNSVDWANRMWAIRKEDTKGEAIPGFDQYQTNSSMTRNQLKAMYGWLPDTEFDCYEQLSEAQKDAVRKVGFTIEGRSRRLSLRDKRLLNPNEFHLVSL